MRIPIYQIDAFITKNKAFGSGNPASVCLLQYNDDITDPIKQKIAAQVNQSMTAFVSPQFSKNTETNNSYKIQYFTPIQEFGLCGHATVATVMLLYQKIKTNDKTIDYKMNGNNKSIVFEFETKSGEVLFATIDRNELITLSMPIHLTKSIRFDEEWAQNLIKWTLGPNLDLNCVEEFGLSQKFILIKLKDSKENMNDLNKVEPNFQQLLIADRKGVQNAIIVTQKANFDVESVHFYSRVFAPWIGVDEDPVCGSAHTQLAPFWSQQLSINGVLVGQQCSKRGGIINCFIRGDRVELSGSAAIVFGGHFLL